MGKERFEAREQGSRQVDRRLWLEERRTGIGGSDAAAVLGISPWRTAAEVWLDKRGHASARSATEAMQLGIALEPVIADRYAAATGRVLWNPERIYRHPVHSWMLATPDRLVVGEERGVECKNVGSHNVHRWGQPGTDEVPQEYLVQCAHYMAVLDLPVWDVAALMGGSEVRVYTVQRDLELEQLLVEQLGGWWQRYMVLGEEHPMDAGPGVASALTSRWPRERTAEPVECPQATEWAARLAKARQLEAEAGTERVLCENSIKALMGEQGRVRGPGWSATWLATKPREATDWRAVAEALMRVAPREVGEQLLLQHTEAGVPVRRFVFKAEGA